MLQDNHDGIEWAVDSMKRENKRRRPDSLLEELGTDYQHASYAIRASAYSWAAVRDNNCVSFSHTLAPHRFHGFRWTTAGLGWPKRLDCQADTAWTNYEWTVTAKMPLPAITSPGGPEVSVPLADRLHAGAASWRKPSAEQDALQSLINVRNRCRRQAKQQSGQFKHPARFVMVAVLPEAADHRKKKGVNKHTPILSYAGICREKD